MDVKPDRMVSLGYGSYWRSDAIQGLARIERERGPRRRTEVFVEGHSEPVVASRSERAILADLCVDADELVRLADVREVIGDLTELLNEMPDVVKRMLTSEAHLDVEVWIPRLRQILNQQEVGDLSEQNDMFG